jgi:hypothetical protein
VESKEAESAATYWQTTLAPAALSASMALAEDFKP